jgi:hypothetical protein
MELIGVDGSLTAAQTVEIRAGSLENPADPGYFDPLHALRKPFLGLIRFFCERFKAGLCQPAFDQALLEFRMSPMEGQETPQNGRMRRQAQDGQINFRNRLLRNTEDIR